MLADQSTLGPGGLPVSAASWLITVDTGHPTGPVVSPGHRLSAVVAGLRGHPGLGGLQVTTGLPQVLAALASSLVVSRSLLLIGSLQLLLLATAAAALAARLLASQREEETAILSARGAARGQLLLASLSEAALMAVAGALAGIVAGSYLTGRLMSANRLPARHPAGGLPGLVQQRGRRGRLVARGVIVAGVIIVVMWPCCAPSRRGPPGPAGACRHLAATARAGLDVALISLGALALWELHRYSAVPRLAGGTLGIDPVLAVAPVIALAGITLLPLRILPAAARLLDRLSTRGRRLAGALASWQVSRRAVREGSPVLLVILAVATGTLVLAQHQSWRQSQLDQAALTAGADVRVTLAAPLPLAAAGCSRRPAASTPPCRPPRSIAGSTSWPSTPAAAATVLLRPDLSRLPPARSVATDRPPRPGPGLTLPGRPARLPSRPRCCRRRYPAGALGGLARAGQPVRAGRLGHRLLGGGRHAARRRPVPPADRHSRRHRRSPLPAPPAGRVPELSAAGVPGSPLPQMAARRAALRAEHAPRTPPPRWTSAAWPSPRGLGGLPGPVRRAGRAGVARRGLLHDLADPNWPTASRPPSPPGRPRGHGRAGAAAGSGHLVQVAGGPRNR